MSDADKSSRDAEKSSPPERDERQGEWAAAADTLQPPPNVSTDEAPNIEGRRPTRPEGGFGQLWQKDYVATLAIDQSPQELTAYWKREFGDLWPPDHHYTSAFRGIQPGEVSALDIPVPGGMRLASGVRVLHADDTSFTLQTAEGHMFAGWIQFSVSGEPRNLVAHVQVVMRASDPLYELGLRFGGHDREDWFWSYALRELAERFGCEPRVSVRHRLLDRRVRWKALGNIRHNAWIRTTLHRLTLPLRRLFRRLRGEPEVAPPARQER